MGLTINIEQISFIQTWSLTFDRYHSCLRQSWRQQCPVIIVGIHGYPDPRDFGYLCIAFIWGLERNNKKSEIARRLDGLWLALYAGALQIGRKSTPDDRRLELSSSSNNLGSWKWSSNWNVKFGHDGDESHHGDVSSTIKKGRFKMFLIVRGMGACAQWSQ